MAEAAVTVAAEIAAEHMVDSIATQLGYIWNYKTNFEDLKRQHEKLKDTLAHVQHSVEEAERKGEEIEQKVVRWLNSAEMIIEDVKKIIDDNNGANMRCFKSLCPDLKKRYHIGKKAAFKVKEVSEVEKEGNSLGEVSYRTLSKEPWGQFLIDYEDFESRRSIVEDVLKALSNSDVHMVGVYGMGGAGKTTLARVVGKQADKVFDVVVFVEVSETPDVRIIQKEIAGKLGLELQAESTESVIANKLYEQLQKGRKNILLILDNIWKGGFEYLKKVGIPFGDNHGACKLLLTARSIDVLKKDLNSPTNFAVDHLNEKDAWDLFKKVAGGCIEQHGLQLLASDVAKRCGGLPIAIVTIAKALKDKQEHAWKTALLELQRPSLENLGSMTAEAYSCIRLSYNHLNSNELKSIFLLCCTMGFTFDHSVERLLRYGMGLNLLNTVCSMGEARNRVNTLIQDLKNFSLLLEAFDDERFSIHDVVRDVGRAIAINDHNNYTVNDDRILCDLAEKNTLKNCTSIILHDIAKLPEVLDCSQLEFLYIKPKTRFSKIHDNFFKGMPNLRVLHLIEMVLSPLPTSFHLLKKLQTLHLDGCHLGDTVDIGKMKNLKILVLSSDIKQLPEQIGELTRLKVLDLSKCSNLEVIPPNTISRLTQLEELYMPDMFDQWQVEGVEGERSNGSLGELEHLSQLTALQIYIPDAKLVPKGMEVFQKLQRYRLYIGAEEWRHRYRSYDETSRVLVLKYDDANISVEDGIIKQLNEIEDLELIGKQGGVKNILYELNRDGFPKLKHFRVESNPELVYIVDFPKQSEPCVSFPHLQTLYLRFLSSLEKICHGQFSSPNSFCQLRTMEVISCVKLKNIFSSSIARHLSQLQEIKVFDCENMEEIFSIVGSENEEIVLEKLESLDLYRLPKLRSFTYDEEEVGSTCDEERQMKDSLMPLFDGKVKFRNLKTMRLHTINLKYVFSSSTLGSFVQLQCLYIDNCTILEEIIRIDHDLKNNVELPSLEKLESLDLRNLPKLRSFTYEEEVGSTSDEERQMKDTLMPLFDGKVKFRNLKTMELWEINLKYVFSSSTLGSFVQLQSLEINNCTVLEEIIRIDHDLKNNVELPSLKKLKIEKCPQMKSFIFSDKVTFPSLEEIKMSGMDNLEMIWHNQFEDSQNVQNCQKLCKVSVSNCQSLKNLFPASIVRNLWQLKDICVEECGIKEIVAKKEGAEEAGDRMFLFPELTSLSLHNLQELKCLYPGIHTTKWPMLKKLNVFGCDKIDASEFFNIQEVISEDLPDIVSQGKVLPNLEELGLDGRKNSMVWQRPFQEIFLPKLKFLEFWNNESTVLSPNVLRRSHNLERLSVENSSYEWIFSCEEIEEYAQIKSLYVTGLGNLKQIWKQDSKVDTILQNLESLVVRSCASLVTLLPPSASFQNLTVLTVNDCRLINLISSSTAKSLMQLKEMEINYCNMMTEVVTGDEAGIEDEINFKNLKSLKLISLSRLRRFCSRNYNFNFPSLEILKVENCPKMSIFCSKATNTPMLRELKLDWTSYYCDGDVNTTMEQIHEKKVFSSDDLILSANEIRMILQKFPEHKFSKVESLEVFDDESTIFPLDILKRFQNLYCLKLSYTSYKEIFSCEEVEKHADTLAQIKGLGLEKLDDLEQMWKQDSRSDLILHNLQALEVVECNSLITVVPTSASFQNLRYMVVSGCNGLRSLVTAAVAKSLVQLERLQIRNCNEMTEVVAIDGDVKEDEIIFNNLEELEMTNLSNLTSFYSGNYTLNFPSLNELQVTRCPKMKFFSSGISSIPMLQQIEWGSSKYNLEGDLNTTIQRINEEMNVERSTKDCAGPSTQHLD
ncbi:hypothetical protein EZV62_004470 [Acer yangbiense]|uniref:Uncharacterized protein n=1 Tax=Acer yangbiense TaxID=1000413 RepID=A0A5C7IK58_9ROSI|nr:hypothetical protein EZV62_004470 [Acer yangbiense]